MLIYPAIDLKDGDCVRLLHGRFDLVTRYDDHPGRRLAAFVAEGAQWVHIVDLDGAEAGRAVQHELIGALAASVDVKIQSGGGVRSETDVESLLAAGVSRVVVGSQAVTKPDLVAAWLERFGPEQMTLAFDVKLEDGVPVPSLKGWTESSGVDLWAALDRYPAGTLTHVLITDVGRDGALTGPNLELLAEVRGRRPDLKIQASGGVSSLEDLAACRAIGCDGAIVGRAIYEGRFTAAEAIGGRAVTARRIIPCLDVKDGRVVKGVKFVGHTDMGDAAELAARYRDEGADELVFYDITASPEGRTLDYGWVRDIARLLDIPFCVAGGVRSVDQAARCLDNGADKVSINSPALERPALIAEMAERLGSQCVVVGVDSRFEDGEWVVHKYTGDPDARRRAGKATMDWIVEAQGLGAGEIVLNCIDQDGVRRGYDIDQLKAARARLTIPLIASGGAGAPEHFARVFEEADVSGALAASVFHTGAIAIPDLKRYLADQGQEMRI